MLPPPVAKLELELADCFEDLLRDPPSQSPRDSIDTEYSLDCLESIEALHAFGELEIPDIPDVAPPPMSDVSDSDAPTDEPEKRSNTGHLVWTARELRDLDKAIARHGFRWRRIAACLPGRSEDAVRQAYSRRHHRPKMRTGPMGCVIGHRPHWSAAEDSLLRSGVIAYQKRWRTIVREFGLRHTPTAAKGRAYRLGLV